MLMRSWLASRSVPVAAAPAPPAVPQKPILVARVAIARGQILKPADVTTRQWPESALAGDYILAGAAAQKAVIGAVAREPFVAGEPLIKAKLVTPGERGFLAAVLRPGMRAVSVAVDQTSDVSGFIMPGDRVDLLITLPLPQGEAGATGYRHKAAQTVLRNLRVIGIDQQLDNKDGKAVRARTVTFEVTPKESEIVALAADMPGKLSLSLRSLAAARPPEADAPALVAAKGDATAWRAAAKDGEAPKDLTGELTEELPGELPEELPERSAAANDGEAGGRPVKPAAGRAADGFTLDNEVSPLLGGADVNHNLRDDKVCILRGNGNSSNSCESQPSPRGS
jgi:pilus assembly protein CpaB